MATWYELLHEYLPNGQNARHLVEAVERLLAVRGWSPPLNYGGAQQVLAWGLPVWMTRGLAGVERLHSLLAQEIVESGAPTSSVRAELSAAGLCIGLGASGGHAVPRADTPTPDWRLEWSQGPEVDVEVTVASEKADLVGRRSLATELAKAVYGKDRRFDVIIYVADIRSERDRQSIAAAISSIDLGQVLEQPDRWRVTTQVITRSAHVIVEGPDPNKADDRPSWWPHPADKIWVAHGVLADPDARSAPPQTKVCFGVPRDGYLNPIQRKAEAPQGAPGRPFLVAVDVGRLPDAFRALPAELDGYLQFWPSVSGFLLYDDLLGRDDYIGWTWRLVTNPHAMAELPRELTDGTAGLPQRMECRLPLA